MYQKEYEFRKVKEHIEVYDAGEFVLSADTTYEAAVDLALLESQASQHSVPCT